MSALTVKLVLDWWPAPFRLSLPVFAQAVLAPLPFSVYRPLRGLLCTLALTKLVRPRCVFVHFATTLVRFALLTLEVFGLPLGYFEQTEQPHRVIFVQLLFLYAADDTHI